MQAYGPELTGREVTAFMPQVSFDPPVVSALFLLRPQDPGDPVPR